jgi:hypothetical protein
MQFYTYAELKDVVLNETGTIGQEIVSELELKSFFNSAIKECESEINGIYEDYFLVRFTPINVVANQANYALPTNLFASKIRSVVFRDGSDIYPVRKMTGTQNFLDIEMNEYYQTTEDYQFIIVNNPTTFLPEIFLTPTPQSTVANGLVIWGWRLSNKMVSDSSICDIPEFYSFIISYVKARIFTKLGDPRTGIAQGDLERERMLMKDTLSNMVPNGDNLLPMDLSFYGDC